MLSSYLFKTKFKIDDKFNAKSIFEIILMQNKDF